MGTVTLPVPVNRSGENVSPMPCTAPPPLGRVRAWGDVPDLLLIEGPPDRVAGLHFLERVHEEQAQVIKLGELGHIGEAHVPRANDREAVLTRQWLGGGLQILTEAVCPRHTHLG